MLLCLYCGSPSTLLFWVEVKECCVASNAHLNHKEWELATKPHEAYIYICPKMKERSPHYCRNSENMVILKSVLLYVM
jgi:hypothetical protein